MKKKFLLAFMIMCVGVFAFGMLTVSAYTGTQYGDYLYYTETDGEITITDCDESAMEIEIPSEIGGKPVTSIGSKAFYYCENITNVSMPDRITYIGEFAFSNCSSLKSITLSNSITRIEAYTFSKCSSLEYITIPNNVTVIGDYAFYEGALVNIDLSDNLKSIGRCAFNCCDFTDISFPEGLGSIGTLAFFGCNFTNITLPDTVSYIGEEAFKSCRYLETIKLPDNKGLKSLERCTFMYCKNLKKIVIPDSVTTLGNGVFWYCSSLENIEIPKNVTSIGTCVFSDCTSLTSITIPNKLSSIGEYSFDNCSNLSIVYYHGNAIDWYSMSRGSNNTSLINAQRIYFSYVTFLGEYDGADNEKKHPLNTCINIADFEEKTGYTLHAFTDEECTQEFDLSTPISEDITLYLKYIINEYTYRFLDEDNKTVLKETTADYGTVITPPDEPTKVGTQKYSYTFIGWNGFADGMTLEKDITFVAQYQESIKKYTYKFFDEDNATVLKEATVDYGTVITAPEISDKTAYYLFDYWDGYTSGMELTGDITFTAVYKYKDYKIIASGLNVPVTVTYNSSYTIEPQSKSGYNFIGYFTETDGNGTQITNGKGESLKVYDVVGDLTVYPYFYSGYMNKVAMQGTNSAMPGDTIKQSAIFATDKEAMYFVATVKYPEYLNFKSISGSDFAEASKDSETVKDGYKYLDITCIYDYDENNMPINQNLIPFEITFDVATNAPIEETTVSIENVILIGNSDYQITDLTDNTLTINPKLAESVAITGNSSIDKITKYSAVVSPDYTTDKEVVWSVDNEEVATISQDGTLTPKTTGTVRITATAKDGSGEFDTKTINVTAYATITNIEYDGISIDIIPDKYDYTIYVKNDTTKISLTPTFTGGGTLKLNDSTIWLSGRAKEIDLTDTETTITLNRNNATDMTDSAYTVNIVKFEGTKTTVSDDGTKFTVKPINIAKDNTVILALYNGDTFVATQSATYTGEDIPFTTDKTYTNAKVFVWSDLESLIPILRS